jgi:hypothetical protein
LQDRGLSTYRELCFAALGECGEESREEVDAVFGGDGEVAAGWRRTVVSIQGSR